MHVRHSSAVHMCACGADEKEKTDLEGRIVEKNKTHRITFRLTDKEVVDLETAMALENFRSKSKYIRRQLFSKQVRRRNLKPTDENLPREVAMLGAGVKKIGVNYNQVVKAVNTAAKLKKRDGSPAVSPRHLEHQLGELHGQMDEIISLFHQFMEKFNL